MKLIASAEDLFTEVPRREILRSWRKTTPEGYDVLVG